MYLAERVKKTLMQKEQLIFKNMQKYKQTSLKQNQHLLAKSTETDAKQTIINAKPTPVFFFLKFCRTYTGHYVGLSVKSSTTMWDLFSKASR